MTLWGVHIMALPILLRVRLLAAAIAFLPQVATGSQSQCRQEAIKERITTCTTMLGECTGYTGTFCSNKVSCTRPASQACINAYSGGTFRGFHTFYCDNLDSGNRGSSREAIIEKICPTPEHQPEKAQSQTTTAGDIVVGAAAVVGTLYILDKIFSDKPADPPYIEGPLPPRPAEAPTSTAPKTNAQPPLPSAPPGFAAGFDYAARRQSIATRRAEILSSGRTPLILVDATGGGFKRLSQYISKEGEIVFNVSAHAAAELEFAETELRFSARFNEDKFGLLIPYNLVKAIYAKETGVGWEFIRR